VVLDISSASFRVLSRPTSVAISGRHFMSVGMRISSPRLLLVYRFDGVEFLWNQVVFSCSTRDANVVDFATTRGAY
jgi:hypothetical protein